MADNHAPDSAGSLAGLIAFLEQLPEPHIVCDADYRIVAANRAYRQIFRDSPEPVGSTCFAVSHGFEVPCDQAGEPCPLRHSLASGRRERALHLHHGPDGEAYVEIELTPLANGARAPNHFVERMVPLAVATSVSAADGLVGRTPAFQDMLALLARVAPAEATVLLHGESGTGKELVAKAIHARSHRAEGPFVTVDCSSLPETLFESEVFGHEKGAFTGATTRSPGMVEAARGGTLFLDEVGDIPLAMQIKLLRLLETGTYRRVGTPALSQADVRLVSATHRDLRQMVEAGTFRRDLYFRINTFPIELPPLRERVQDIPLLAESLLERVAPQRRLAVSAAAMVRLCSHAYPGNVRELRNILERASLLCDGSEILPEHLPCDLGPMPDVGEAADSATVRARRAALPSLEELQLDALRRRLSESRGSRKALAAELGLSERTLYRKLRKLAAAP